MQYVRETGQNIIRLLHLVEQLDATLPCIPALDSYVLMSSTVRFFMLNYFITTFIILHLSSPSACDNILQATDYVLILSFLHVKNPEDYFRKCSYSFSFLGEINTKISSIFMRTHVYVLVPLK